MKERHKELLRKIAVIQSCFNNNSITQSQRDIDFEKVLDRFEIDIRYDEILDFYEKFLQTVGD